MIGVVADQISATVINIIQELPQLPHISNCGTPDSVLSQSSDSITNRKDKPTNWLNYKDSMPEEDIEATSNTTIKKTQHQQYLPQLVPPHSCKGD